MNLIAGVSGYSIQSSRDVFKGLHLKIRDFVRIEIFCTVGFVVRLSFFGRANLYMNSRPERGFFRPGHCSQVTPDM